jgi:hypothetical protein
MEAVEIKLEKLRETYVELSAKYDHCHTELAS